MFYCNSCRSFFSLPVSHQVVAPTAHGPPHSLRLLLIVGMDKTSKKYFCRMFSHFFEGSSVLIDENMRKHAAKVFFGCFVATTFLRICLFSQLGGCDKTSKKYFCRMFSLVWSLYQIVFEKQRYIFKSGFDMSNSRII